MKAKLGRATYVGGFGLAEGSTNVKQEHDEVSQAPLPIPDLTAVAETAGQAIKHIADAADVFVQSLNGEESEGVATNIGGEGDIPPDPGAWGVAAIVEGVYEGLSGFSDDLGWLYNTCAYHRISNIVLSCQCAIIY